MAQSKNLFNLPVSIVRSNPLPLDASEIWNTVAEAEEYAKNSGIAFIGQRLFIKETNSLYLITDAEGTLVSLNKLLGLDTLDARYFGGLTADEWKETLQLGHLLPFEAVKELPECSEKTVGKIYLVPHKKDNIKEEYITILEKNEYSWEKIGDTAADLDAYVKKGTVTAKGGALTTEKSDKLTVMSSEASLGKLPGIATVTYEKSAEVTEVSGEGKKAKTEKAGEFTYTPKFKGTEAEIEVEVETSSLDDHIYTPAGSVNLTQVEAKTTTINDISKAELEKAPEFTGKDIKLNIEAKVKDTEVATHVYTPAGELKGTQVISGHSHSAVQNIEKDNLVEAITEVSEFNGGFHEADTFTTNTPTSLNLDKFYGGGIEGATPAVFKQGSKAAFTQGAKAQFSAQVKNKTLSFNFKPNGNDTFVSNGDDIFVTNNLGTFKQAHFDQGFYTAGTAASFISGAYKPAELGKVTTTKVLKSLPQITVIAADDTTVDFTNAQFVGKPVELKHEVTDGSINIKQTLTPEGTISVPAIKLSSKEKTVATEGIRAVSGVFAGTEAVIKHTFTEVAEEKVLTTKYIPEGTINGLEIPGHTHEYIKPIEHSHEISLKETKAEGETIIDFGKHTHEVIVPSHTHDIKEHTHIVGK